MYLHKILNGLFSLCMMLAVLYAHADDLRSENTINFLSISDIHFDPFYSCNTAAATCSIIETLRKAPASDWQTILTSNAKQNQSYGKDTSYSLFASSLEEIKKESAYYHVRFALVLGDFLAHDFKQHYQQYTGDTSSEGLHSFVDKTLQFMVLSLKHNLPNIDIYPVVGNNDGYSEHYVSEPLFYKNSGPIFAQLIHDKIKQTDMVDQFSKNGYYALTIPTQPAIRLIVLNTTLFSQQATGTDAAGQEELSWLHKEVSLLAQRNQKALLALHIPVGPDIYDTIKQGKTVTFWRTEATKNFLTEMNQYSDHIIAILPGHVHVDWFQIIHTTANKSIIVTATPSISPVIGNNPGFKIYRYAQRSEKIKDYITYYYPLAQQQPWAIEYDFKKIYQPDCQECDLLNGIQNIQASGSLAEHYKKFYALGRDVQPITKNNQWLPYYYCAINHVAIADYEHCITIPAN